MQKNSRSIGLWAENAVAEKLEEYGYRILDRNYHTRFGELDIIAELGGMIVFVEVKYRRSGVFGRPAQAVTSKKKMRIIKTAETYLFEKGLADAPVRFDVAEVYKDCRIDMIEDAFDINIYLEGDN